MAFGRARPLALGKKDSKVCVASLVAQMRRPMFESRGGIGAR